MKVETGELLSIGRFARLTGLQTFVPGTIARLLAWVAEPGLESQRPRSG
jgi:hypothetical protein